MVEDECDYQYGQARKTVFENNLYWDLHTNRPPDPKAILKNPLLKNPGVHENSWKTLSAYLPTPNSLCISAGKIIPDNGQHDVLNNKLIPNRKPTIGACENR